MAECPKCQGRMQIGFPYIEMMGWRSPVRWAEGEIQKSYWNGLSFDGKRSDMRTLACENCGFVELYAGNPGAAHYGGHLKAENDRLKLEMSRVLDRVATLERIATDPAERTAREIEELRKLPGPEDKRD